MPETVTHCPLCGNQQNVIFDQREFHGYRVENRLCSHCGLVYQSPRMTGPELDEFYQVRYREVYQGSQEPSKKDLSVQEARAEMLVKLFKEVDITAVNRCLDIGSSSGLLIEKMQEAYRCQVVGIEPGDGYRIFAERKGLKIYQDLDEVEESEEPVFDLISMIHVLEHLPDPLNFLLRLKRKLLTPNGRLIIEVPNLYAHDCFEIAHLISFSRQTLAQMVKKAGFRTEFLITHGQPRSQLIPLYISLIASPADDLAEQEKFESENAVRLKRRTGMIHRKIIERLFPQQAWLLEYRG